jgi:hypothetical protein
MEQQEPADKVRWYVTSHAEECVQNLQETGESPRAEAAVRTVGTWTVLVAAFPTPTTNGVPLGMTECDHNCLALLAQARHRSQAPMPPALPSYHGPQTVSPWEISPTDPLALPDESVSGVDEYKRPPTFGFLDTSGGLLHLLARQFTDGVQVAQMDSRHGRYLGFDLLLVGGWVYWSHP